MRDAEVGVNEVMLLDVEFESEADVEKRLAYKTGYPSLHRSPIFQSSPLVQLGIEEPRPALDINDQYAPPWRTDLVQALPDPPKPYTPCPDFTLEMSMGTNDLGTVLDEVMVRALHRSLTTLGCVAEHHYVEVAPWVKRQNRE